jgi:hypothetical protein
VLNQIPENGNLAYRELNVVDDHGWRETKTKRKGGEEEERDKGEGRGGSGVWMWK